METKHVATGSLAPVSHRIMTAVTGMEGCMLMSALLSNKGGKYVASQTIRSLSMMLINIRIVQ